MVTLAEVRTSSAEFVEQRLRILQVGSVEALGEPVIDRREEVAASQRFARSRQSRAKLMTARSSQSLAFWSRAAASAW